MFLEKKMKIVVVFCGIYEIFLNKNKNLIYGFYKFIYNSFIMGVYGLL